jgi:DnaJ-domain-containing protein 1
MRAVRRRRGQVDAYQVLGLEDGADQAQARRAYRAQARFWHPDTNSSPDAPERLARVVDAYQQLRRDAAATASPTRQPDRPDPEPAPPAAQTPPTRPVRRPKPRGATVVAGPVRISGLPWS